MKHGDLVRNIDTNKSGVVVARALAGEYVQVEYADGSRDIHHRRSLELNPTDELQENDKDNR